MGSSSNPPTDVSAPIQDLYYLYASNVNVSNFVSVKLSGDTNYHLWKTQMVCLMDSHDMCGIVDDTFDLPRASSMKMMRQYNSLLKGWMFGSISDGLLGTVVDLGSAKEVWDKLKSFYDPTISSQQDSAQQKLEAKTRTKDRDMVSIETKTNKIDVVSTQTKIEDKDVVRTTTETNDIDVVSVEKETANKEVVQVEIKVPIETEKRAEQTNSKAGGKSMRNKKLCKAIVEGSWEEVEYILKVDQDATTEAINSDGNTMLHIAVGIGRNYFVKDIISSLNSVQLPELINLDGSTALHIAAIVGNRDAAELLIKNNKSLLEILDKKGKTPLDKAYENMHLDTIEYLLKAANDDGNTKKKSFPLEDSLSPGVEKGVNLLVNAISAKQYDLATKLVNKFPEFSIENDNVLMAIARTFPSGLNYGEKLIYPSNFDDACETIVKKSELLFILPRDYYDVIKYSVPSMLADLVASDVFTLLLGSMIITLITIPIITLIWIYFFIRLLMLMAYFPLYMLYLLLWMVARRVVAPIKNIEKKKKEWEEAKKVLKLVCNEIDKLESPDTHPRYYTEPVLEAARQNAYEVVDEILLRSPEAIRYKDKFGYDIIQLAVIHRSEKIYNLIYIIGERKSVYRTIEDSSKNNMLHLAGKLAPSHKLQRITGAALQLQRELQWREEVEKLVFPTYITKENIFMETPDMVFTKEHEDLVKEGEKWMKTVAESCSITAALITTIVFAAAITVPGGSNQETGFPVFTEDIAFTIFAIADAISLFTSSTALLMFLSILTARFAEQDFLVSLPRRLIIGLCTLLISTTAMMVAFGATLFIVFCQQRSWMLVPICVFAFLPIVSFGTLQVPIIVDLFRSTYGHIFGKKVDNNSNGFNPNDIRLFFGK